MAGIAVVVVVVLGVIVSAAQERHDYDEGDLIPVYVDSVGSFHNPAEAFDYYSLPVCRPDSVEQLPQSFGDALTGKHLQNSVYEIRFKKFTRRKKACSLNLDRAMIQTYTGIIQQDYVYTGYIDGLPIQGFFGDTETNTFEVDDHVHNVTNIYLYPHTIFTLQFNGDNVISCAISSDADSRVLLKPSLTSAKVEFTYSVEWESVGVAYAERVQHHTRALFSEQSLNIHWLSIINSFVLVLLLTIFLAIIILRILRNDFARYSERTEGDLLLESAVDESGWKQVHGDVFRFPTRPMALCSMVGAGVHIFACLTALCILSLFSQHGSSFYTAAILLYTATAPIGGYTSAYLYKQLGGDVKWATNAMLTSMIFAGPLTVVFVVLNSVASLHGSVVAVPFTTTLTLFLTWALLAVPLTVLGAIRGRKAAKPFEAPCQTSRVPREIPATPWFQKPLATAFMAGFLPFSAIYIDLHYIFAAVWGHQVYRLFGMLALAFVMLVLVTSFITVALTYFQLAHENYLWWWSSFMNGGSGGAFVFAYSFFYYFARSSMSGFLQASFFFGYMVIISLAFFLMLGAIGFASSLPFVKYIYSSIKSD